MKELLLFRSYITGSVSRDFNLRYRGSVLGAALVFLAPAFQIALYVLVFGNLLQGRLPGNASFYGYSVYLCAGILFWNLFFEIIQRSQNLYLENANLIKKAAFPLSALSVVNVVSCSINLGLSLLLFGLFLALSLAWPGWGVWGLVPVWLAVAAVAVALGQCLAILQVFFRDFTVQSLVRPRGHRASPGLEHACACIVQLAFHAGDIDPGPWIGPPLAPQIAPRLT